MRDAIATTTRLARAAVSLAAERLRDGGDLPRRAAELRPAMLTGLLQAEFPGVRVRALEAVDCHAGTTDRARLAVSYDDPGRGAPPPASVFVKTAPPDFTTRLFVDVMRLGSTEVRFYREIAPHLGVERPRLYGTALAAPTQRFLLVIEDLAARGAEFTDISRRTTVEDARTVLRELARLHASFWNSPRLRGDLAWLRAPDRRPDAALERQLCRMALAPALRRFAEVVPPAVREMGPRIMAARDAFEAVWARGPLTVVHGDAHVGNFYFLPATIGFLDWQVVQCCQGMRDVTYFLINSVPTAVRREHQRELIGHYLENLHAQGVAALGPDDAWMQYRLHAPWAWIAAVVTASSATMQAGVIARAGMSRSCAALLELDPLGALEQVGGARVRPG